MVAQESCARLRARPRSGVISHGTQHRVKIPYSTVAVDRGCDTTMGSILFSGDRLPAVAMTPKTTIRSGFRGDIQGLRAIAVAAVVLYHAGVPFLPGGYVGVDVFFVISGFLITAHLLSSLERDGRVKFASFYARRVRRILPASFVVLALSVVAALLWFPPLLMNEVWKGALATALYVPNMLFAAEGTNYLAETAPSVFQHYWSLGIEEQFYLLWPLLLAFGWGVLRSRRTLGLVLVTLVALSFAACVFLTFYAQPWAFFSLPTRAWELGMGGLVAFALSRRPVILPDWAAPAAGWAGVAGILGSVVLLNSDTAFPGYWAMLPVASTALVILAGANDSSHGPSRTLSARPMLFIGAISYSLYLVHWPALIIPDVATGGSLPQWLTLLIAVLCVPAAWLMYKYVENPARSAQWLVRARPRRSLFGAAVASVAAIALATGAYGFSSTQVLSTNETAPAAVASNPPIFTEFVPSNLTPSLRDTADSQPVIYDDGCHRNFASVDSTGCVYGDDSLPRIVLFGDSHAAQWFPAVSAFATENGYSLEVHTKSSCPSVTADVKRKGVFYGECSTWRQGVIDRLNQEEPAMVLLSNYGIERLPYSEGDHAVAWGTALSETIDRLDVPVAVIADTPDLKDSPSICLSARLDDTHSCGKSRDFALKSITRSVEESVTAERGVPLIDLTDFICDPEWCAPITGNVLIYRDAHHITTAFSSLLGEPLARELQRAF